MSPNFYKDSYHKIDFDSQTLPNFLLTISVIYKNISKLIYSMINLFFTFKHVDRYGYYSKKSLKKLNYCITLNLQQNKMFFTNSVH